MTNNSTLHEFERKKETLVKEWKAAAESYLPVRGGSFRAPNEINNCSAATRASADGGVGKGKFTTCTNRI